MLAFGHNSPSSTHVIGAETDNYPSYIHPKIRLCLYIVQFLYIYPRLSHSLVKAYYLITNLYVTSQSMLLHFNVAAMPIAYDMIARVDHEVRMPKLVDPSPSDPPKVRLVKELIQQMAVYNPEDRISMRSVSDSMHELLK